MSNRRGLNDLKKEDGKAKGIEEFSNVGASSATATMRPTQRHENNNLLADITKKAEETSDEAVKAATDSGLTITVYNNGYRIGTNPFQPANSDESRLFLERLRNGEVPPELEELMKGSDSSIAADIAVKLDVKKEDYVDPASSNFNFAASRGLSLLDQPIQRSADLSHIEGKAMEVKEDETKCVVQIILQNRQRVRLQVNHSTTVAQLYQHINSIESRGGIPAEANYTLVGGFPVKEYNDGSVTIGAAKLANSSLTQQVVQ
eukprot:UN01557